MGKTKRFIVVPHERPVGAKTMPEWHVHDTQIDGGVNMDCLRKYGPETHWCVAETKWRAQKIASSLNKEA